MKCFAQSLFILPMVFDWINHFQEDRLSSISFLLTIVCYPSRYFGKVVRICEMLLLHSKPLVASLFVIQIRSFFCSLSLCRL